MQLHASDGRLGFNYINIVGDVQSLEENFSEHVEMKEQLMKIQSNLLCRLGQLQSGDNIVRRADESPCKLIQDGGRGTHITSNEHRWRWPMDGSESRCSTSSEQSVVSSTSSTSSRRSSSVNGKLFARVSVRHFVTVYCILYDMSAASWLDCLWNTPCMLPSAAVPVITGLHSLRLGNHAHHVTGRYVTWPLYRILCDKYCKYAALWISLSTVHQHGRVFVFIVTFDILKINYVSLSI